MTNRISIYYLASAIFIFSMVLEFLPLPRSALVSAQSPPSSLNFVPEGAEEAGRPPAQLVWIRPGLQSVIDPVDGDLVLIDDGGRIVGRAPLPQGFEVTGTFRDTSNVYYLNTGTGQQIVLSRTVDPASPGALVPTPLITNRSAATPRVERKDARHISIEPRGLTRTSRPLNVNSISGGFLSSAAEIGRDVQGKFYIQGEEVVSSSPALDVRVHVSRFDASGRLTGIARIPLEAMNTVPKGFATVTDEGVLRVLIPAAHTITIREIPFAAVDAIDSRRSRGPISMYLQRNLPPPSRSIQVDTHIEQVGGPFDLPAEPTVRRSLAPIRRTTILKNARAYLTVNWVMAEANYAHPEIENRCAKLEGKYWRRPVRFTKASIGQSFGPMPYRWGGDSTPEAYRKDVLKGLLAGDICTCRESVYGQCVVREAVGVDCSGFVSRAWGLDKYGTSALYKVADALPSIFDLRPGDALNKAGSHVRLFTGFTSGANKLAQTIESATKRECEGVCEGTYSLAELHGYTPVRYRRITD